MPPTDLCLRALTADDDDALRELFADPATTVWNPGPAPDDVARWRAENAEPADDFRTWTICDGSGPLLGIVSLFTIDDATGSAEIGFRTLPAARGRGVARAAVTLASAWALDERGLERIVLYHAVQNAASCAVATACGYVLDETLPANYTYGDGQLHDEHLHVLRGLRSQL